jgi:transposase-like protein
MVKRKTYTAEFKAGIVLEILTEQKSIAQASREYGIKDSVISRWKQEFIERSPQIFKKENQRDERDQRIAELERMIGRLAMELEMSKKVSRFLNSE